MADNRGVAYIEPGKVEIQNIDYPGFEMKDGPGVNPANVGRQTPHGVILRIVSTNICGSDQHMVRGRTTAPAGLILGHEITGEVIEVGREVMGLQVAGVDLLESNVGPKVIEINSSPGFEGLETSTGKNIALEILSYGIAYAQTRKAQRKEASR